MDKKIIGSIGILVGLGLATFLLYLVLFPEGDTRTTAPDPAEKSQVAVQPSSESSQEQATSQPGSAAPKDPATPPAASAPAASDPIALAAKAPAAGAPAAGAPATGPAVVTPTPAPAEITQELRTPLEPTQEHGLLAGRYRGFGSAKKRMEKIKGQDIPAFVRPKGRYYEVWAGPFATPEEAEQARKSLRAVKIYAKKGKLTIPVPK